MNPLVSRIRIYPIKSLDPVELKEAEIGTHSLRYDRAYAMITEDGRFMNGKRSGRVNELKATYDLQRSEVSFSDRQGGPETSFRLDENGRDIQKYLSEFFGERVYLVHSDLGELMDIPSASSVTIVSDASLISLQKEFAEESLERLRLRFRASLELSGVEPYWEESLVATPSVGKRLMVGEVEMIGVSPRARCNVPTRDPLTGIMDKSFVRRMVLRRGDTLPKDSLLYSYGNLYQLALNTFIPKNQQGKWIRVGDALSVTGIVRLNDIL